MSEAKHLGRVTMTPAMLRRQREVEGRRWVRAMEDRRAKVFDWMAEHDRDDTWRRYQVQEFLADGTAGALTLEHFDIPQDDVSSRAWYMIEAGEDRDCGYGRCVRLTDSRLEQGPWMSDTRAEVMEHLPFIKRLAKLEASQVQPTVLITGLGLGLAVRAALLHGAARVDVVELDPDVLTLTGPQFADDPRVTVHVGDALTATIAGPPRWDLAWHDIWPDINDRNLVQMEALKARYQAYWTGAWQEEGCREMARILALKADYEAVCGPIGDDWP
jgi:hypothetical protein